MTIQTETTVQPTPDQLLYKEMRSLLSDNARPEKGVVSAKFHMVYLMVRGKDWKKTVDLTSVKKIEKLLMPFIYNYHVPSYHFERKLTPESFSHFCELAGKIHKEMKELQQTLS